MTCDVCIDVYDVDGYRPSVFCAHNRTAHKVHRCDECYRNIEPGEKYSEERGLWDSEWSTWKTCSDCLSVREAMFSQYQYGELWSNVTDYVDDVRGDVPEACLAAVTPRARGRLCALIEDVWALQ